MPRIKIDYVVSFSSEDPENQASNLLAWDVNKKKWLCSKGDPSCSVVLQLTKAVKICAVHIGAYHAALVEVLVGRSEKPNDPFEVLVPSSVFLTPSESRKDVAVDKVRSFNADNLSSPAAGSKWDRVRVVCSQPYNKHCKYGLSFVHIYSPEGEAPTSSAPLPAVPSRMLALGTFSSDEEEFSPGELFHQHQLKASGASTSGGDTSAQIRQATSQALKNVPDSSIKLNKTPISKAKRHSDVQASDKTHTDRQRDNIMYNDDDDRPHAKIDRIVNRHKDEKIKDEATHKDKTKDINKKDDRHKTFDKPLSNKKQDMTRKDEISSQKNDHESSRTESTMRRNDLETSRNKDDSRQKDAVANRGGIKQTDKDKNTDNSNRELNESRKRLHPDDTKEKAMSLNEVLKGVIFVLSGYENPRRSNLRETAMSMGAQPRRDWGPGCTHLICAFPNTPKLKTVRATAGNKAIVVRGEWIEQCKVRRRRLPWRWFATEPSNYQTPPNDDLDVQSEGDTDDEIERVRQQIKKRRDASLSPTRRNSTPPHNSLQPPSPLRGSSPTNLTIDKNVSNMSTDSDVAFVRDERIQGRISIPDSDEEVTEGEGDDKIETTVERVRESSCLPALFEGRSFVISPALRARSSLAKRLERYLRAYGGEILQMEPDEADDVDFIITESISIKQNGGPAHVTPNWVWRCHEEKRLCPADSSH